MPNKKPKQPKVSDDEQALVQRVDAMMSTELPNSPLAEPKSVEAKPNSKKTTANSPQAQKTAPKLPSKLLKSVEDKAVVEINPPADPPLVIKLADEGEASPDPNPEPESTPEPEPEESPELQAEPIQSQKDPLEDSATDEAVDDIVAHEGDTVLAVDDALAARKQAAAQADHRTGRNHKWLWFIALIIVLGSAIDFFIFMSR